MDKIREKVERKYRTLTNFGEYNLRTQIYTIFSKLLEMEEKLEEIEKKLNKRRK